jgi:hypothetical protein
MRVFRGRAVTVTTAPAGRRSDHTIRDGNADRARRAVAAEPPVRRRPVLRPHVPAAA